MVKELKKIKADDGREEEIEIDKDGLKDEAKLSRWDGECYIKIGRKEKDTKTEIEGSIFKFDVELKKKPNSNVISFDIETKGLKFYYQPPLTAEIGQEGIVTATETDGFDENGKNIRNRPENVVGSYAVYHATAGKIHSSKERAEKYKCGIAFHIYRPKIIDANNNWVWGELYVNKELGILTITVSQSFLDNATYPVIIDPTFGYETEGASNSDHGSYIEAYTDTPASEGTADSVHVSIFSYTAGAKLKGCLYLNADSSLLTPQSAEIVVAATGWNTLAITSGPSITTAAYYITSWGGVQAIRYKYNSGGSGNGYKFLSYNGWPDPIGFSVSSENKSIYCTYTESGAPSDASFMTTNRGFWGS